MSDLIAVAYRDNMHKAAEVLNTMRRLQGEYLIDLEDAAYVTKDRDSKVRLHQSTNIPLIGAMTGTFWGMLVGLLFLNPLLGAALGAGGGALSGSLMDYGINDEFMQKLGRELTPGSSAIFILARHYTPDKVIEELARYGGTILRSSLTREAEQRLQEALSGGHLAAPPNEPALGHETGTSPQPHNPA
ncbi:MAG TPA: DUF1269 domain-containing protein [Burkholderiaceae bacterium]|jgi:uncharacterized membrane protein|nr:DUF1269 domain-containing protein [Burkholderiaceae bacterium]